jgi:hypothetical protein
MMSNKKRGLSSSCGLSLKIFLATSSLLINTNNWKLLRIRGRSSPVWYSDTAPPSRSSYHKYSGW